MYKLEKTFKESTANTEGEIKDEEQLKYFINELFKRKLIIDQDEKLLKIHIKDYPISFEQFVNYIKTIYKLEIEKILQHKITEHNNILTNILKYLDFYINNTNNNLTTEDICKILTSFTENKTLIENAINNINKALFIVNSIHDDIEKFLWEKITETMENKDESFFQKLDVIYDNPAEYQFKMQEKIQEEYEIIRVKKFNSKENLRLPENNIKQLKKITVEEARCADRNIPIWCYKIPNTYYNKDYLESFYFKCEASRDLLLSKYFQKFIGFDEISSNEFQFYFFEFIDGGEKLIPFFKSVEVVDLESSFFFRYIAKEILSAFRDLLNKCTFSFKFPITCDNFYYQKSNFRLYFQDLVFCQKRKSIMDSHQILEAKLLYFYGLILINLLSIKYEGLKDLIITLNNGCQTLEEFGKMQFVFDNIEYIENTLTQNLNQDELICILLECLLSPYKAKIVFDEFYEKKNFLNKALQSRLDKYNKENVTDIKMENKESKNNTSKKNIETTESKFSADKEIMLTPYYTNNEKNESKNENLTKKSLTINKLLIHPFYSNTNLEEPFLRSLFKTEDVKENDNDIKQ